MIKIPFLLAELFLLVVFLIPVFNNIFNPGNAIGLLVTIALILVTVFFEKFVSFLKFHFDTPIGKWVIIISAVVTALAVIYVTVLSCFMTAALTRSPDDAQAVVVLGCKVNGTTPSRMLTRRLDSAKRFLDSHPDAVCVVSGGKGDDEKISEAQAMKTYLTEKGISPERIIPEDKSVNTDENMRFSSDILKKMGIEKAAIVTDGFHQYRAGLIARKYGLETTAVNADTDALTAWLVPTYWIREWLAITAEFIR